MRNDRPARSFRRHDIRLGSKKRVRGRTGFKVKISSSRDGVLVLNGDLPILFTLLRIDNMRDPKSAHKGKALFGLNLPKAAEI
jgi:hypothetical protein